MLIRRLLSRLTRIVPRAGMSGVRRVLEIPSEMVPPIHPLQGICTLLASRQPARVRRCDDLPRDGSASLQ